jgi:hypothetical protein
MQGFCAFPAMQQQNVNGSREPTLLMLHGARMAAKTA